MTSPFAQTAGGLPDESTTPENDEDIQPIESPWHISDDIGLDEMCSEYRRIQAEKLLHEGRAKEIDKELKILAGQIQGRMGGHKSVRTVFGYTLRWIHKTRKGYTVQPSEYDQWELKSPF